jgi:hypothetical protein
VETAECSKSEISADNKLCPAVFVAA